jgi:hypothetical protein
VTNQGKWKKYKMYHMDQVKTGRLKGRKKYQKQMQKLKETEEV